MAKLRRIPTLAQAKVEKTKPFMTKGETKRWKKEGSAREMLKLKKVKW